MTNQSLRERLGIAESNYPAASRIITDVITVGMLKSTDPTSKPKSTHVTCRTGPDEISI